MSRREISKAKQNEIIKKVPNLQPLRDKIRVLSPEIISTKFEPKSRIPIAFVCLNDSFSVLQEANYALGESFAHEVWYKEETENPNELTANYFMRYYSDDVALRLYSASEHLANAIINFLKISRKSMLRHRKKLSSVSVTVGKYLIRQRPKHPVTTSISKLVENPVWKDTITYRDNWVHNQPPLVSGLGVQWQRKTRWTEIVKDGVVTGHFMEFGGSGDNPNISHEELRSIVAKASFAFVETFESVMDCYLDILLKKGIVINGNIVNVKLKQ
ncbi:MAG: hypothetical protein Q8N83_06725 [Ignavibacteria bacterium]|nr:hypothetical protein [Ignavibacteria bacterium]